MKMQDVVDFANKYLKGQTQNLSNLRKRKRFLDFNALSKYGEVIRLTPEDIFGY